MRLYKNDDSGTSQFLGSDNIDHTPRNEDVRLHVGDSFDVTANRKQTDFHIVSPGRYDSSYEFTISNAKTTPQDVLVVEPIPAEWKILAESRAAREELKQHRNLASACPRRRQDDADVHGRSMVLCEGAGARRSRLRSFCYCRRLARSAGADATERVTSDANRTDLT